MARPQATPESPGSRALVVDLIRSAGPISRTELTTATGLTQPAISLIVRKLLDDEVIVEAGTVPSTGGKPRRLLDINRRARHGIGIQLGFESATLVATDTNGGVVARERLPGAGSDAPDDVIARLADSLESFLTAADIPAASVQGVAVVLPGPMRTDPGTVIEAPTLPHWRDVPLRSAFETALRMPVLVDNDASAAALGEFWSRGISRYRSFACVYIGSGIGAGVVVDGALFRGASSNAAEIGHITVDPTGPECFCGNVGCLEVVAAPRAIVARALDDAAITATLGLDERATVAQNWEVLSRAAVDGDSAATALVIESARAVAGATLTLTNLFDLDDIVLSGPGVATAGSLFVREVRASLGRAFARKAHSFSVELSINPTDSAAIGAAALTLQGQLAPGHGPALRFAGP
ncbi:ROK family protein [Microbacterium sp. P26]|uniref:ROK family transcriptional regulator n=1 Tax=Microbacterium TaxID=33882 RepID=UPI00203A4352|nr:ROK family protein [Microbacterium sp. P26]MCM3502335.1 ROK family protein [Microbacterium sp. P26]